MKKRKRKFNACAKGVSGDKEQRTNRIPKQGKERLRCNEKNRTGKKKETRNRSS